MAVILKHPLVVYMGSDQKFSRLTHLFETEKRLEEYFWHTCGFTFFSNKFEYVSDGAKNENFFKIVKERFNQGQGQFDSLIVIIEPHSNEFGRIALGNGVSARSLKTLLCGDLLWAQNIPRFICVDFCQTKMTKGIDYKWAFMSFLISLFKSKK